MIENQYYRNKNNVTLCTVFLFICTWITNISTQLMTDYPIFGIVQLIIYNNS